MKKKTNKKWEPKYTKFIQDLICVLRKEMFLHKYTIGVKYSSKPRDVDDENAHGTVTAEIRTNSTYYFADIMFYPQALDMWKNGDKNSLIECVVHELCHVLNHPLTEQAEKASCSSNEEFILNIVEQSTQHLAIIITSFLRETKPELFK